MVEDQDFIGFVPGDPTVGELLDPIPPPLPELAGNAMIDLRTLDSEALARDAAQHCPEVDLEEPFRLPVTPGVPRERVACFTGHAPHEFLRRGGWTLGERAGTGPYSRVKFRPSETEMVELLGRVLSVPGEPVPWAELGYPGGGLTLQGREVDLRAMWDTVQAWGGFDAVCRTRRWSALAATLGADLPKATNAAFTVKSMYVRFFMAYERSIGTGSIAAEQEVRSAVEAEAAGAAAGESRDMAAVSTGVDVVQRLVCKECGKPCRTETEQNLHTQRTGHAEFEDQTEDGAKPLNTEVEMAEAAGPDESVPSKVEMVEPAVSETALQELEAMGFSRTKAVRALHGTGMDSVEAAITWLEQHAEDADLDTPLLEDEKPKLSAEEAKAKAAELVQKARMKREAEERETERLREQERIRAGKELLAAQRQEEDLKLKRAAEARRLEKEEERRAREKIRAKLEEDKRERRRKLGLSPDPTPEELAAEADRAAQRAAEEAAKRLPPPTVVSDADALRDVLVSIKKQAGDGEATRVTTCFQTLFKLCGNLASQPKNPKFRRVNLGNAALRARLLPGASDFLQRVGWTVVEGDLSSGNAVLELAPGRPDEAARLAVASAQLDSALNNPFFGVL